jgi:hypothetical protein
MIEHVLRSPEAFMCNWLWTVWTSASTDRWLAIIAIALGTVGILRAEWLFEKLYKKEKYIKDAVLREATTVAISYASFSRALQAVELKPLELPKDGAFALLTGFHFQKLLNEDFTPDQFQELFKLERKQVDNMARGYVQELVASGMASPREGIVITPETED